MADETPGFGTLIGHSETSGGSLTNIAEVVDITPPEEEVDDIETTHHASPNKVRQYQGGLIEPGEIEVVLHFEKALKATLRAMRGVNKFWTLTFSDGSKTVYPGYLKAFGEETPLDDIVTISITIKVSGDATYTPAT